MFLFGVGGPRLGPDHKEGGGATGFEVGGGEAEGHRAVEVIFFMPLRWASVEQPTGSRMGGTFLLRAEYVAAMAPWGGAESGRGSLLVRSNNNPLYIF